MYGLKPVPFAPSATPEVAHKLGVHGRNRQLR